MRFFKMLALVGYTECCKVNLPGFDEDLCARNETSLEACKAMYKNAKWLNDDFECVTQVRKGEEIDVCEEKRNKRFF